MWTPTASNGSSGSVRWIGLGRISDCVLEGEIEMNERNDRNDLVRQIEDSVRTHQLVRWTMNASLVLLIFSAVIAYVVGHPWMYYSLVSTSALAAVVGYGYFYQEEKTIDSWILTSVLVRLRLSRYERGLSAAMKFLLDLSEYATQREDPEVSLASFAADYGVPFEQARQTVGELARAGLITVERYATEAMIGFPHYLLPFLLARNRYYLLRLAPVNAPVPSLPRSVVRTI